ncbi:TniB family NTP-binding protein [Methylonatrum kenyense]|uniref:TniB family NTP-binding protein n=1 Tax=Methylonatrum kenyense TaxID=455253 RepID=UPI0020C04BFE|nr:TniB family NTP-binding protein [Methylonatrum kenyense]MCK8515860.1 TniB family NTP-binding protein [Methylonatrum kenyense]
MAKSSRPMEEFLAQFDGRERSPLDNPRLRRETDAFLKTFIKHDRLEEILEAIRRCHNTVGTNPESLILYGESGVGKTFLIRYYARLDAEKRARERAEAGLEADPRDLPIVFFEIPAQSDLGGFLRNMLKALGAPMVGPNTRLAVLQEGIIDLLRARRCELVIVDEIHDVLSKRNRNAKHLQKVIKHIMNETGVPWLAVGLPESLELIELQNDGQMRRRFAACAHLEEFDVSAGDGFAEFEGFVRQVEKNLKVAGLNTIQLTSKEFLYRLFAASRGLPALIARLCTRVIEEFAGTDEKRMSYPHFAMAYSYALEEVEDIDDGMPPFNPFDTSIKLPQIQRYIVGLAR